MYIYCDVLEPRVIVDTMALLLRVAPISGEHGEMITRTSQNVHYIPIQKKMFQELELNMRTDTGQLIPFKRGKVTITPQFRKRSTLWTKWGFLTELIRKHLKIIIYTKLAMGWDIIQESADSLAMESAIYSKVFFTLPCHSYLVEPKQSVNSCWGPGYK